MRIITIIIFIIPAAKAVESTPSAEIKMKLEELKKEIASKAAKLRQEVGNKLKDKAYVGKVKTKSLSAITLATKNGSKIVNINQDTQFDSKIKGKKYSLKLLSEEDYLAALGDVDETDALTARKIILLPTANSELKTYLWGQILAVSDTLITLKDSKLKNVAVSVPNPSFVRVSDFVILTGYWGKNDIFKAEFVSVSKGGIPAGRPKKVATPSSKNATSSSQSN